jgi:hypothetical protein
MLYPTMFWEVLGSHERPTVCAAARAGMNKNVRREIRLPIDFDWGVRFLTVPPLLPVLAHGGGLKSRCNVVLIVELCDRDQTA